MQASVLRGVKTAKAAFEHGATAMRFAAYSLHVVHDALRGAVTAIAMYTATTIRGAHVRASLSMQCLR